MANIADLEAVMDRWAEATERDDWQACVALCTADAIILSSDAQTARGRTEVGALIRQWIDAGDSNDRTTTLTGDVHDDMGWLARAYSIDMDGDEGPVTENGRYVVVMRREADGAWRIAALSIFVSDLP